ncbi:hypothetical protein NP493_772g00013 [Ridgeia piscesae]|uniref:F5/8 type C domain-containing protein n=1 Tax=Ridgeia piscesae TaxID=27915 RepID=A0AAD9KP79_RIDPI|nr:hypothetical protein NP493_772g00013 [Ridgeia piscesae]
MQSGKIPDTSISASSSFDAKSVGPHNARIRTETNGGAWCPKPQVAEGITEWLEIDLGELKVITAVETQGRFGNGQGMEYATNFRLQYQRADGGKWLDYRNKRSEPLFSGNKNTHIAVLSDVKPPIIARRVRFIPHSRYKRTVCMRVEVYGCPWKDGIVSYSMHQGDSRGSEVDLYDITYDGDVKDSFLSGGLGQLIDWDEGIDNFRLDMDSVGKKGYEWVGWKNDTVARQPVVITFEFDHVRNFSMILLHCNNLFSKGVSVFRMARVYFSVGGKYYNSEPVEYEYMVDVVMQMARWVHIPIPNHIGRFIRLELYFENRWILLSEVRINSTIVTSNVTEETAPVIPPSPAPSGDRNGKKTGMLNNGIYEQMSADGTTSGRGHKTQRNGSGHGDMKSEAGTVKALDDTYVGIIIGAVAALVLLCGIIFVFVFRRQRKKYKGSPHKLFGTNHMNFNLDDLTPAMANGKLSNGNMYNSIATMDEKEAMREKLNSNDVYREPVDGIQHRTLPVPPGDYSDKDYTVPPDLSKYSALVVNLPPNPIFHSTNPVRETSPSPPPPTPPPPPHFRITDVTNIQGLMGNSIYALPSGDIWQGENMSVIECPRENLQFIERLGEGQFGEVHLCEAVRVEDFLGEDFLESGMRSLLVAVKTLRDDAGQQARCVLVVTHVGLDQYCSNTYTCN